MRKNWLGETDPDSRNVCHNGWFKSIWIGNLSPDAEFIHVTGVKFWWGWYIFWKLKEEIKKFFKSCFFLAKVISRNSFPLRPIRPFELRKRNIYYYFFSKHTVAYDHNFTIWSCYLFFSKIYYRFGIFTSTYLAFQKTSFCSKNKITSLLKLLLQTYST